MSEKERSKIPSGEEIAAALRATAELVARRRAVPEEERVLVTNPKFTEPFALDAADPGSDAGAAD